jgi:hypothetical protein
MLNKFRWFLWICGLVLIGNFVILRLYGDTLQSTNLFIVRGTVFYPYSWLNLIGGVTLIIILITESLTNRRKH